MPISTSDPVLGYVAFCAVKMAGYSMAAHQFNNLYQKKETSPFLIGGVRTLIGMAVGALYFFTWTTLHAGSVSHPLYYLSGLVPLRFIEWWALVWLFYDRPLKQRGKGWGMATAGTLWSFFLDVPALLGFIVTGGMSVC